MEKEKKLKINVAISNGIKYKEKRVWKLIKDEVSALQHLVSMLCFFLMHLCGSQHYTDFFTKHLEEGKPCLQPLLS